MNQIYLPCRTVFGVLFLLMILCILLLHCGAAEGLMCPAGTIALPSLDACYFFSTQTMDWNNAETVI